MINPRAGQVLRCFMLVGLLAVGGAQAQSQARTQVLVEAEDDGGFSRMLELPAHRALIRLIKKPATTLDAFETDGCSGGLSQVWQLVADQIPDFKAAHQSEPPWEQCCVVHDRVYHNAGGATDASASFAARLTADRALEACVEDTGTARRDMLAIRYEVTPDQVDAAYRTIAGAMLLAVRFGGAPCSGLPWRWGFGYANCSILATGDD